MQLGTYDIDRLLDAVAWQETRNNHYAVSPKGARTKYGIMPATAADPGYGLQGTSIDALMADENKARDFSRQYLQAMYERTGNVGAALAAYNGGLGRGMAYNKGAKLPTETANYVPSVLKHYDRMGSKPMMLGPSEKPMNVIQPQFAPIDQNNMIDPKKLTPIQLAMIQAQGGGLMGPGSTPGMKSNPMQLAMGQGDPSMFDPMAVPNNAPMNPNQSVAGGGVIPPMQQAMQLGPDDGPMDMAQDGPGGESAEKSPFYKDRGYWKKALIGAGAGLSMIDNPGGAAVAAKMLDDLDEDSLTAYQAAMLGLKANEDPVGDFMRKHAYKDALKAAEDWTAAAKKADEDLARIKDLRGLLSNIDEKNLGPVGEAKLMVDQLAVQMGMDPANFKDMDARAAFGSLVKQRALSERNPAGGSGMPGNFSDQDRKYLDKIAGGLFLNKASNELILDLSEAMFKRQAEAAREADRYLRTRGTAEGLIEHMDKWRNEKSVFADRPDYNTTETPTPKVFKTPGGLDIELLD